MASREMVENMVECFCNLFGWHSAPSLNDSWQKALSRYADDDIRRAGQRAMEECAKMPTAADVIQRIPIGDNAENGKYAMASARCQECGRVLLCISEPTGNPYKCRECYTGLTNQEIAGRFRKLGMEVIS